MIRLIDFNPATIKHSVRRKLKNLGFRVHTHLGLSTFLLKIYQLLGTRHDLVVTPSTQLVIEEAARTATTFAYYSFLHVQPEPSACGLPYSPAGPDHQGSRTQGS